MPEVCSICGIPIHGAGLCEPCSGLLRWIQGYFAHIPDRTGKITLSTDFVRDLAVESLDWMHWLLEAEEKLDLIIPDDKTEKIRNVGEFIHFLRLAGASWPSGQDLLLRPRRRCWSLFVWDVVDRQASNP